MGTLVGHVAPGFGFFLVGLWHLLNHIRLHAISPNSYASLPWFPVPRLRHLELFLIMAGSAASVSMELFIGPQRHQPLDSDGTIPSNHLHNFEHSNISISFFVYASFSLLLDKLSAPSAAPAKYALTQFLGAAAFFQQLLLFHLHSADHMGVEGQYHWLLQIVIFVSLLTTLMGIGYPNSFIVSFIRSLSILFQGVWLAVMGFMLWTPAFIPKGCFINLEEGHHVVRCHGAESLERAKSLVNIQFSWYVIGITALSITLYLILVKLHSPENFQYVIMTRDEEEEEEEDIESQKTKKNSRGKLGELTQSRSFVEMGKGYASMDIER